MHTTTLVSLFRGKACYPKQFEIKKRILNKFNNYFGKVHRISSSAFFYVCFCQLQSLNCFSYWIFFIFRIILLDRVALLIYGVLSIWVQGRFDVMWKLWGSYRYCQWYPVAYTQEVTSTQNLHMIATCNLYDLVTAMY